MADGSRAARSRPLAFHKEKVADLFAGGGGASLGMAWAYRHPDIAINHNPVAIAVHEANHRETEHYVSDIFEVDPIKASRGEPIGVLWASPDCRHHSRAKGGQPRSAKIRGLAWIVIRWAYETRPRIICLENVIEWATWGRLGPDGKIDKAHMGETFRAFVAMLSTGIALDDPAVAEMREAIGDSVPDSALVKGLGYKVEHRELVAADYGAPTIRKRLYLVARCDGRPIAWPEPTHARASDPRVKAGQLKPWRAAAECIDFHRPSKSIFDRKKPLALNTRRRIAKGLWRYVLANASPYIVRLGQTGGNGDYSNALSTPLTTITTKAEHCLVAPTLVDVAHGEVGRNGSRRWCLGARAVDTPLSTVVASGGNSALAGAVLTTLRGTTEAHLQGDSVTEPLSAVAAQGQHHGMVLAHMTAFGQNTIGSEATEPAPTVMAGATRHGLVAAHVTKFRANSIGIGLDEPMPVITAGGDMKRPAGAAHALGLVSAHIQPLTHHGERRGHPLDEPLPTVTGANRGELAMVGAFLEQANGGYYDGEGRAVHQPVSTVCASGANQRLVSAYLVKYYRDGGQWQGCTDPMHTIPTKSRMGLVETVHLPVDDIAPELLERARACAAFLHEHLPEHFPTPADLVLVGGHLLADITLRMLAPRELARAQGFPEDYVLETGADGRKVTKTDQVKLIGNSVVPQVAEALVRANARELIALYQAHTAEAA